MKRLLVTIALAPLALAANAGAATKTYTVQPFERISVAAGIELKAQIGPAQSLVAETDGNDFTDLVIEVDGGELMIGRPMRPFSFNWGQRPHYKVTVTVPALHGLHASSSGSADVTGPVTGDAEIAASSSGRAKLAEIKGGAVALHASSSGGLEIQTLEGTSVAAHASSSGHLEVAQMRAGVVSAHASSSGGMEVSGSCDTLDADASSSGRIRAGELHCVNVVAQASSGAGIEAFASKSLNAMASSGGHISVAGKPAQVQVHESSGGSVQVEK
jgi:hypothetical protein